MIMLFKWSKINIIYFTLYIAKCVPLVVVVERIAWSTDSESDVGGSSNRLVGPHVIKIEEPDKD